MINITNELKAKLLAAQSAEEVTELVKADGQEITAEKAAHFWEEIKKLREQDGKELSLDELEAVSGGSRNYLTEGCAATVEPDSDCWGTDGGCWVINIDYSNWPDNLQCPKCGRYVHKVRDIYSYGNNSEHNLPRGSYHVCECPKCSTVYIRF